MGKRIVILGADYSANGIAQSNPIDSAYFSIYPQEIENGVSFQSGLGTFLGPCVPLLQGGQMTTILSSIDKKNVTVSVGIIDPISATIVAAYYNIPLTGYETDVRDLNIIVPKGHYVGYANIYTGSDMDAPSAFDFTTDFGANHFECKGRNVGDSVNLTMFATLGITLGCKVEVEQYTTSIQEISPSLESGGQAFTGGSALGPVIGAENDGIMTKVLSSLDKISTPIILAIVNPNGVIVSTYKLKLTGYETDVRGYNIIVPKGHYVGYANVTGGSSIFNFVLSGLPHFESTALAVGSSVKLNQFAGLSITLGCQIELISISSTEPDEPDTPVVPDVPDNPDVLSVQTIEPSLQDIASATTLVNRTIAIGSSRNPAQGGGYLRSVTSAVTGKYIRIVIVGADLNVISISDDIYLSEATTDIRNLNIYIPYDGYVAYANSETEQTGAIVYINSGGQPHLEVSASVGATAKPNAFPTMRLAMGCEIEITESAGGDGSEEEPDTPVEPDEPTTPDEPDVTYEYQTIAPSPNAASGLSSVSVFIGPAEIVTERDGYIDSILSSKDVRFARIGVVDSANTLIYASDAIELTGEKTDVRDLNIFVPAGSRIGFANATHTAYCLYFTTATGTKHFEVSATLGSTANLLKFPTMEISFGCEIELVN